MASYYYVNGFNKLAKIENRIPYVYKEKIGWVADNLIKDCQMGSHLDYDEITEDQAGKIISKIES